MAQKHTQASKTEPLPTSTDPSSFLSLALDDPSQGLGSRLARLLHRALDEEGVPRTWPVETWWPILNALAMARQRHEVVWPERLDRRLEGFVRAALRFTRPDGRAIGEGEADSAGRIKLMRTWADWLPDPAIASVVARWFPTRSRKAQAANAPPLPAFACSDRPLAILRPDWSPQGDLIAVDHRATDLPCGLTLVGGGRAWMGPHWLGADTTARPRLTAWKTGPYADFLEWTYPSERGRTTRTALLLRGRDLALIGELVEGPGESVQAFGLGPGVVTKALEGSTVVLLKAAKSGTARVVPLALPMTPSASGSCEVVNGRLTIRFLHSGKRGWSPLLVSWGTERARKPVRWRALTVTRKSKVCPADVAVAWRVWWSQDDSIVIYRSLAKHESSVFLGHQTKVGTRFFVAEFDEDGDMRPLLTV